MTDTKTYRGRTVEEVLPQIRSELGPEALILARREGLAGGVGGFFQRSFVEVDARGPVEDPQLEVRSDRATAEGLSTPGIQALLAQASPFANQLAEAAAKPTGLYGPQPAAPAPEPEPDPEPAIETQETSRSRFLRDGLVASGLPAKLADEVVDEAVRHGIAFASPRALKSLVRAALAQRIPAMGPLGASPRTVAIVGPACAGKTTAAARLAAAYRGAGMPVRELTAGDPTSREPYDGLTVLDAPATGVRDADRIKEVARTLRGVKAEVHLALPATMSAPAAGDLAAALKPLKPTHVLLTHADETAHPGAAVGHAITTGLPLSYVSGADALMPADPADLAKRLTA
jgi:flagellar biosynthesis GTPase FlhF